MTLDEYMKNAEGYVGIAAASGYLFIGTKEQYEEEIDVLHKKAVSLAREALCDANKKIKALQDGGFNSVEVFIYVPKTTDPEILKGSFASWRMAADELAQKAKLLRGFTEKYESAVRSKERAERIIQSLPYRERRIKETYKSITEDKMCVIIEGDEGGRFWDMSEAERSRRSDNSKDIKHNA